MNDSSALNLIAGISVLAFSFAFFVTGSLAITRCRETVSLRKGQREDESEPVSGLGFGRKIILDNSDKYFLACQIGAFLSALLIGYLVDHLAKESSVWNFAGLNPSDPIFAWYVPEIVLLTVVGFLALVAVQVLKAFALSKPESMLGVVALPVIVFGAICSPLVAVLNPVVHRILKIVGRDCPVEHELAFSSDEIAVIVEESSMAGTIEDNKSEMIRGVFTLSNTVVREIMTPRKDIISIDDSLTLLEAVAVFVREGLSRLLVTGNNLDDVKGVLLAKDLMPYVGKSVGSGGIKGLVRSPWFVPNTKKVDELIPEFREKGVHLAVVLDEHGGVDGIVTVEDLVEEVVGEIVDEHDMPAELVELRTTRSGDTLIDGSMSIDDLNTQHNFSFPLGEYDTIAGFVIHQLGRIPSAGEVLEFEGLKIRVEETSQNRITMLRVLTETSDSSSLPVGEGLTPDGPDSSENGSEPLKVGISGSR